ncbi:hypothetical protein [Nocardia sp. NPDC056100]|uniref:hypothetical protein n=1 Tax=Nocardia sp. NPDC056100 TaxID=3345712 RepID=UPI0035DBCF68
MCRSFAGEIGEGTDTDRELPGGTITEALECVSGPGVVGDVAGTPGPAVPSQAGAATAVRLRIMRNTVRRMRFRLHYRCGWSTICLLYPVSRRSSGLRNHRIAANRIPGHVLSRHADTYAQPARIVFEQAETGHRGGINPLV